MNSPNIVITQLDADRLDALLASLSKQQFPGKERLEEELVRATVVDSKDIPPNTVTMNSVVIFRTGDDKEFSLKLVYPVDYDGSADKVSILAPIGSALLGLTEGDSISWPIHGGVTTNVQIIRVAEQPERSGNYAL